MPVAWSRRSTSAVVAELHVAGSNQRPTASKPAVAAASTAPAGSRSSTVPAASDSSRVPATHVDGGVPERLAQGPLVDLAHRGAADGLDDVDRARALVTRQPLPAPRDQFVGGGRLGRIGGHDERLDLLAHLLVRHSDDRHVGDLGMLDEHLLGLRRVDVHASGHDQVAEAIGDVHEPVVGDVADLAQREHARAEVRPGRLLGVAGVDHTPPGGVLEEQTSLDPRRHFLVVLVDHDGPERRHGATHRSGVLEPLRAGDRARRAHLGGAVRVLQHRAEPLDHLALDVDRAGGAGVGDELQRAHVVPVPHVPGSASRRTKWVGTMTVVSIRWVSIERSTFSASKRPRTTTGTPGRQQTHARQRARVVHRADHQMGAEAGERHCGRAPPRARSSCPHRRTSSAGARRPWDGRWSRTCTSGSAAARRRMTARAATPPPATPPTTGSRVRRSGPSRSRAARPPGRRRRGRSRPSPARRRAPAPPESARMYVTSSTLRWKLTGTVDAPASRPPRCASTVSTLFSASTATRRSGPRSSSPSPLTTRFRMSFDLGPAERHVVVAQRHLVWTLDGEVGGDEHHQCVPPPHPERSVGGHDEHHGAFAAGPLRAVGDPGAHPPQLARAVRALALDDELPGLDDVQRVARMRVHAERGVRGERHLAHGRVGADPAQEDVRLDVVVLEPSVLVIVDRPAADRVVGGHRRVPPSPAGPTASERSRPGVRN